MRRFLTLLILSLVLITCSTAVASAGRQSDPVAPSAPGMPDSPDTPDAATYVYWTEVLKGTILRGNANGSGSAQTCVTGQKDPSGLVVVAELDQMFWLDREEGRLRRANLNCPAGDIYQYSHSLTYPDRLVVDRDSGMLYWTENQSNTGKSNRIRRARIDGTGSAETVVSDLGAPVGLSIGTVSGQRYLYWTEFESSTIWRIPLSGGSKEKLVNLGKGANPLDIALDVDNNRMYWLSGVLDGIYSATLNGDSPSLWLSTDGPRSMVMDNAAGQLYWGAQGSKEIRRINLDKSGNQVLFNSADGVDRPLGVALMLTSGPPPCYALNRSRNPAAGGSIPTASPGSSSGCGSGNYTAGQAITLTAAPAAGWRVAGWTGTNNDSSTATTNTVTMPAANHTAGVIYEQIPATCYPLDRSRSPAAGGSIPTASPGSSSGCGSGNYTAGQAITLTAAPAAGWRVAGWTGTNNDSSTATTNTVTMPAANHTAGVIYEQIPAGTEYRTLLPSVLNIPWAGPTCFAGPGEAELNNSSATANGPLCAPGDYTGLPNDGLDYFMFDMTAAGRIVIEVANHRGGGVQLLLYRNEVAGDPVAEDNYQNDGLRVEVPNGAPGRYYIIIYSATPKPGETQRYTMNVNHP